MLFAFEFTGERFHGRRKHAYAFLRNIDAVLSDDRSIAMAKGMRNDHDRQAHVSDAFTHDLRKRGKGGADDGHRRDAEIFQCGRVTRGPGGGRPSVTHTIDDGIALRRHLLRIR